METKAEKAIQEKKNVLVPILETQEHLGSGLRVSVNWSQVSKSMGAAVFELNSPHVPDISNFLHAEFALSTIVILVCLNSLSILP